MIYQAIENRFARLLNQLDLAELKSIVDEYCDEENLRWHFIRSLSVEDKANIIENFPQHMASCEYIRIKTIEGLTAEISQVNEYIITIDQKIALEPNKIGHKTMKLFCRHRLKQLEEDISGLKGDIV